MFVSWFALQEEQERRSGIKEPSHSDSDSSSGSKKYVKLQSHNCWDFLNDQIAMIHVVIVMFMMPVSLLLMMMLMMSMGIVDDDDDDDDDE